jgi:hypothetical protein
MLLIGPTDVVNDSGTALVRRAATGCWSSYITRTNPPPMLRIQVLKELEDQRGVRIQADHRTVRIFRKQLL